MRELSWRRNRVSMLQAPAQSPHWQQQIEPVAQLPKSQQQFVARTIEMALAQASAQGVAR
jgi:hypothetical protein